MNPNPYPLEASVHYTISNFEIVQAQIQAISGVLPPNSVDVSSIYGSIEVQTIDAGSISGSFEAPTIPASSISGSLQYSLSGQLFDTNTHRIVTVGGPRMPASLVPTFTDIDLHKKVEEIVTAQSFPLLVAVSEHYPVPDEVLRYVTGGRNVIVRLLQEISRIQKQVEQRSVPSATSRVVVSLPSEISGDRE